MNEEQNNLYVKLHEEAPLICMSYIQPLIKDPTQVSTVFVDDNDFYLSNKEIQTFIRLINLHCKREKAIGEWLRYAQGLKHDTETLTKKGCLEYQPLAELSLGRLALIQKAWIVCDEISEIFATPGLCWVADYISCQLNFFVGNISGGVSRIQSHQMTGECFYSKDSIYKRNREDNLRLSEGEGLLNLKFEPFQEEYINFLKGRNLLGMMDRPMVEAAILQKAQSDPDFDYKAFQPYLRLKKRLDRVIRRSKELHTYVLSGSEIVKPQKKRPKR
jgi:hypothetical protein